MIDQKTIDELKAAHPDGLFRLSSGDVEVIVRTPSRGEFKRFMSQSARPEMRFEAVEALVRSTLLYPSQDVFGAMLEKKPGLCGEFAEKVAEIAGITGQATSQKL